MSRITRLAVITVAGATVTVAGLLYTATTPPPEPAETPAFHLCTEADPCPLAPRPLQEDDPGWDCRTMGNRVCGPTPRGA